MRSQQLDAVDTIASQKLNALYRKVSIRLLPFLVISFIVAFLDRVNIGFAQVQMKHDLGYSDAIYGVAAGIFFIGYVLFEVPSNMLLHRIGAKKTFARIMICWGIVSVAMAYATTPAMLYTMRFLLGVFEAGFFPGIILYLSYWFPANRRASCTSWVFAAMALAGVIGSLLANLIMEGLDEVLGLHGWQWLFVLEGAPAIILGIVAIAVMTDTPAGATWLNATEKALIQADIARDPTLGVPGEMNWNSVFTQPVVWMLTFVYFSLCSVTMALNFWLPTLVREAAPAGASNMIALCAIPFAVGAIAILLLARWSDRTRKRGLYYLIPMLAGCSALALLALLPALDLRTTLLLLSIAVGGTFACLPVFWSIPHQFFSSESTPAGLAFISSVGSMGAFVSPTIIGWSRSAIGSHCPALIAIVVCAGLASLLLFHLLGQSARGLVPPTPS